jgi:hypothetical protein
MRSAGCWASRILFVAVALALPASGSAAQQPSAPAARLDHVVLIVPDLDSAAVSLERLGFRIKPGRLHANNLINRHIEFRDGTEIELMSLAGPPGDSMALRYEALLARGTGGAYVALGSGDLDAVDTEARRLGLPTRRSSSGPWRFLGFPGPSDASAIFFVARGTPADDPAPVTSHRNGALALTEAWVEGGPLLDSLLLAVGARPGGAVQGPDARPGTRWHLASGQVVVLPRPSPDQWPRPVGAVLGRTRLAAVPMSFHRLPPAFWIVLTNDVVER